MAATKTSKNGYGSFPEPRRVEILHSRGSTYFKPGQFAYVIGWDDRGGFHRIDKGSSSKAGQRVYMVSKTKGARGGALWFSADGIRFTRSASK